MYAHSPSFSHGKFNFASLSHISVIADVVEEEVVVDHGVVVVGPVLVVVGHGVVVVGPVTVVVLKYVVVVPKRGVVVGIGASDHSQQQTLPDPKGQLVGYRYDMISAVRQVL